MHYIGVDLGGTNIAAGIVTEDGRILVKKSVPTLREREYPAIMKDIALLCQSLISDFGIDIKDVDSIGVGSPGTPDPVNGILVYTNNLKFKNTPVRSEIRKYIDLPVYLENDANCAALGEFTSGAASGAKNSVFITLGTGIGGGIIIGGRIFSGSFFGGAEIGHHIIHMNGEQCSCGRNGCWEAYASATALIRDTKIAVIKNPDSLINGMINGDLNLITAKTCFDAAKADDETAQELVDNYIMYIAEGVANMVNIFQPDILVLGGGVSYQGDKLLKPVKEIVGNLIFGRNLKTEILIATLGNDAGIIGAAMLGKQAKL